MRYATTVIIGAGQSGLAMSRHLADRSIDHVLIERGEVANAWRKERWDSLRLLTPNWQSRLPGYAYDGDDPNGYMNMPEVVRFLQTYAQRIDAPIHDNTNVKSVRPTERGYFVATDRGEWQCDRLVLATGACNVATVPAIAEGLPNTIRSITPMQYRNPDALPAGGVMIVGASATGVQLAKEIQASGRQVTLSVGEHVRVPRLYRGRDIKWWMDVTGVMDQRYTAVDDINRARRVPSLQLVGTPERITLDLNALVQDGVDVVGRMQGLRDGVAQFSGALANQCALADLKMNRLLDGIDAWASHNGVDAEVGAPERFEPTRVDVNSTLSMHLADRNIRTIIWATGYRPDYSWLHAPVLDRKGRIRHNGGVVDMPGNPGSLYVMGLPFMRRRKSSFIDGAGDDAHELAEHLAASLRSAAA